MLAGDLVVGDGGLWITLGIILASHVVSITTGNPQTLWLDGKDRELIEGKRVILVDDSVVRGTTSIKIKDMMLDAGASEVHFRIASPPTAWPCFYGVDTPQREKLLAATMYEDEMRDHLGVDSLKFVTLDGLYRAFGEASGRRVLDPQFCDA